MWPTLNYNGDRVLVIYNKLFSFFRPLSYGDIVTAVSPRDPDMIVCKRVIGLGGDIIWYDPTGSVIKRDTNRVSVRQWVQVPVGNVWLEGDNPAISRDSRIYGPVPLAMIRGRVVARVWPRPRWLESTSTRQTAIFESQNDSSSEFHLGAQLFDGSER